MRIINFYKVTQLIIVFVAFSGLPFYIEYLFTSNFLKVDYFLQATMLGLMLIFSLTYFKPNYITLILSGFFFLLSWFPIYAPHLARAHSVFWLGSKSKVREYNLAIITLLLGTFCGSASIFFEALYITYVGSVKVLPAGFFINPSNAIVIVISILALKKYKNRKPLKIYVSFIMASVLLTGSRVSIGLLMIVIIYIFRLEIIRIILLSSIFILPVLFSKDSPILTSISKLKQSFSEAQVFVSPITSSVAGYSGPRTSGFERSSGFSTLMENKVFFLPEMGLESLSTGHIGWVTLYLTLGLVTLIFYILLSCFILSPRDLFLIFFLFYFFTDPILFFGINIMIIRSLQNRLSVTKCLRLKYLNKYASKLD